MTYRLTPDELHSLISPFVLRTWYRHYRVRSTAHDDIRRYVQVSLNGHITCQRYIINIRSAVYSYASCLQYWQKCPSEQVCDPCLCCPFYDMVEILYLSAVSVSWYSSIVGSGIDYIIASREKPRVHLFFLWFWFKPPPFPVMPVTTLTE